MRTKTLALSALLGMIGSASLVAQTNVYSLNAVGYINVTLYPGYNIITCPLIASPDNTIATVLNNTNGQYQSGHGGSTLRAGVYQMAGGQYVASDSASSGNAPSGWSAGGTITMNPGQAIFFFNPEPLGTGSNMYATFVGTVPQTNTALSSQLANGLTNALNPGFNLVGSIVPASGDLMTNSITSLTTTITPTKFDYLYAYDPTYNSGTGQQNAYSSQGQDEYVHSWAFDLQLSNVYTGFFYYNNKATTNYWVENFSINP